MKKITHFHSLPLTFLLSNSSLIVCAQSPTYNWLIRVPDLNKEFHASNCAVDYRSNGTGTSYVKMGMNDVSYNVTITSAEAVGGSKDYNGDIVNAGSNGSGQIVIQCTPSENVCFTIGAMVEDATPTTFQNDFYVHSTEDLYKGNFLTISQVGGGGFSLSVENCVTTENDYFPPIMLPCDNVHTFCGYPGGVRKIGDFYYVTCYPSSDACVSINVDSSPDECCW